MPEAKVRTLLAVLLAHRGRPLSVARLVEQIWGDDPPEHPAPALQRKIWQLRRTLDQAEPGARALVESRPPGYALRVEETAVDAGSFRALTGRARESADPRERARLLTEALGLWRGPAYADFTEADFARAEINRLEEERLLAVEERAEALLEAGEHDRVVAELGELVAAHPVRERLRAAHMRALHRLGRQSEALGSFRELRSHLREEQGVDPEPAVVALHQEILEQRVAGGSGGNLPAALTLLVGRDDAVADVRALVSEGRLVTLTGSGGVGKTRLAVAAAQGLVGEYPDGVWLVELAGPREPSETSVSGPPAETVAVTLDLRDGAGLGRGGRDQRAPRGELTRLVHAVRGWRALLILDSCEHVVDQAAELAGALLRGAPGIRVLATSREPLGHAGEVVWTVPPLDVPDPDADPAEIARAGAVRLFVARASAAAPGFRLDAGNAADVATLCRRLDGVPLALELAATRVRALGVRDVLCRLDDRFRLLASGHRGAPPRQQTLQAVIDWSWDLLTPRERVLLSRLAIFGEGFTLEAAEAVCSGPDLPEADVPDLLARLVDRSLVAVVEGPRYRLLESVAEYGLRRLCEAGELPALRRRHTRHYLELAERAEPLLRGPAQFETTRRLDEAAANLRLALDGAVRERAAEFALRLVDALAWYWFLRGRWSEALRSMDCVLAIDPAAPARLRARVGAWEAGITVLNGGPVDPRAVLGRFDLAEDPSGRARAEWFLSFALYGGDLRTAESLADRALAGFRAVGDAWGVAAALTTRAAQAIAGGDLVTAEDAGERGLAAFDRIGDPWGRLYAMESLTVLAEAHGDHARARRLHEESLRLADKLGLPVGTWARGTPIAEAAPRNADDCR
ncbi:BTAD domain-containing putative transcriptional regulator [Nonomuraea longicatena]|uniref:BTAD domain-containing putative transcriptional regulator n=1 Tax=Nonomuraea longicatena TaxID=83682 RepID=A0ABN1P9Z1_9ACTN